MVNCLGRTVEIAVMPVMSRDQAEIWQARCVWSIVQDNVEKRAVNLNFAVVLDEAQLAEAVHEETHP